jgi:DNA-binding MarR family transcriptional regulator
MSAIMDGMPPRIRDAVDHHVARWAEYWKDNPRFDGEVQGAITRMQAVLKQLKRANAVAFAGSDFTLEDFSTLHHLMVMPYPTEATPAQLAEAANVTRAGMTSRLDRLVDSGLVSREVDPVDRRRIVVRPTPAGRDNWESYVHAGMSREQQLLQVLSPRELQQLNGLLRKVILSFDND